MHRRIPFRDISCVQVVYVDEGTLLFSNLEELVLTGNLITLLSTAYLPAEIKVIAVTVFVCLFVFWE